jgi:hypothetical protein
MCIIAAKFPEAQHPSTDEIKEMWKRNPHGAGLAYPDVAGGISIVKGLMTLDAFMEAAKPLLEIPNSFYLMHFRIATHGSTGPTMTHPFWIKDGKIALAHNGILPYHKVLSDQDDRSDTAGFVEDVLAKLPEDWYTSPVWRHVVEEYMGWGNKFAVIEPKGIALLNKSAWKEDPVTKMVYSNESYKVYKAAPYTGGNQAGNFRTRSPKKSGGSVTTPTTPPTTASSRPAAYAALGKRCASVVASGKLTGEEAKLICREVRAGDWMPEEAEEFLDFHIRTSVLFKTEQPTLLGTLALLGRVNVNDMASVPDIMMAAEVLAVLDAIEELKMDGHDAMVELCKHVDDALLDENTDTPTISYEPIRLWDEKNAGIFLDKPVRVSLEDGQFRVGKCTAVNADGITYHRHDGGYGTVPWTNVKDIITRLTLHNPRLTDLQRHIGCMVSVGMIKTSENYSGQLVSLGQDKFTVKCDMGISITAMYDEILSVTIDEDPPHFAQQKG